MSNQPVSRAKTIFVYVATILLGFAFFALPNLFFGISKLNGGLSGINLAIIGILQFVLVSTLIYFSLKYLNKDMAFIGLNFKHWKQDALLGFAVTVVRVVIDFGFIIPATGGANRADVLEAINALDGTAVGLISLIILGVIGGGITEEIYNRGFFIMVLKDLFKNERTGLWIASLLSILFFSAGHLPNSILLWYDILVASIIYTCLFLYTGRLTASIVAHGAWNFTAILIFNFTY